MIGLLHRLRSDARGNALVEFAFAAPVLATLALGSFDAAKMVGRQTELQEVAAEVSGLVMAGSTDLVELKAVAMSSGNLDQNQASVSEYRLCSNSDVHQSMSYTCPSGEESADMIQVALTDSYTPLWTSFGISGPVNYSVTRSVQAQ
jgi:Flp pilus assembly protein TadG